MASELLSDDAFVRLFQERAGLTPDGWAGADTIAALDKLFPRPEQPASGLVPPAYFPLLARIESNNRPYVKAATSSASGLYQFIKSSWEAEGGEWGTISSKAFGGLRPSEAEQTRRAETFTDKNARYLANKGIESNEASLYASHFLGVLTASRMIAAGIDERADVIAGPAATKANRSILDGKTVGEFYSWLHRKTGVWAR